MAISNSKNRVMTKTREWASLRQARIDDVAAIQNIYKEVYKGTYSYPEYLDTTFLRNDMECGHSIWYVVEDLARKKTCGCVSATADLNNRTAYFRGMMIHPTWQGRGGMTKIFGLAFQRAMQNFGSQTRIGWCEVRTQSVKPQIITESVGMVPVGILPLKDVFFHQRESAIIMAAYFPFAWENRCASIRLFSPLELLYNNVRKSFEPMYNDDIEVEEMSSVDKYREKTPIDVIVSEIKYGYLLYNFMLKKTGEFLRIIVNPQCANAEHMEFQCSNSNIFLALLNCMLHHMRDIGIKYIEGTCPATNPGFQEAFLLSGMQPLGYLPAWKLDITTNRFIDQIVFGWIRESFNFKAITTSTKSALLARILVNN